MEVERVSISDHTESEHDEDDGHSQVHLSSPLSVFVSLALSMRGIGGADVCVDA